MIAMLALGGCARGGSEIAGQCPPVVKYSRAGQARAARKVEALPEGALVVQMLSDYAVQREQVRDCG